MKTKLLCTCVAAMLILTTGTGQNKVKFQSMNSFGVAVGEGGGNTLLQSTNGVVFKNLFGGIGAGVDNYNYKTVPLFFDAKKYFPKQNIFVFIDLGYNFSTHNEPLGDVYYTSYKFKGGFYDDLGLGCKFKFVKSSFVFVTASYSYKKLYNKVVVVNPCLVGPCPENHDTYEYSYRRILLKAGIGF